MNKGNDIKGTTEKRENNKGKIRVKRKFCEKIIKKKQEVQTKMNAALAAE